MAAGCDAKGAYLSFQEYFEKLRDNPVRWGKPFSALLGALSAQLGLGVAAIGGKDSMSGSFLGLDVPPTLISFAIAPERAGNVLSPEFKEAGHPVYLFRPEDFRDYGALSALWAKFHGLCLDGTVKAAWAVGPGGAAEAVMKMSFGNRIGFLVDPRLESDPFWDPTPGAIVAECGREIPGALLLGYTSDEPIVTLKNDSASIEELLQCAEGVLERVYPTRTPASGGVKAISWEGRSPAVCAHKTARPKAVIPVFPGTNCEYDTAAACLRAGIEPEIVVVKNLSAGLLAQSAQALEQAIQGAQMIVLPGGFSGGDEPDGSAKFICSFFRYVTTRVASVNSPWMLRSQVGDLHAIPVSHGEGKFVAPGALLEELITRGQVATQYVDLGGAPSMDIAANPNGSVLAIEGIFSPDGRVFGKMGHSERRGTYIAKNIPGDKYQPIFESGAAYFQ